MLKMRRQPCQNVAHGVLVTKVHIGLIVIRLKAAMYRSRVSLKKTEGLANPSPDPGRVRWALWSKLA